MRYRLSFSVYEIGPGQYRGEAMATPIGPQGQPMQRPYIRGRGRGPTRRSAMQMALQSALRVAPKLALTMPKVGIPLKIASQLARTGVGKKALSRAARGIWRGLKSIF